MCGNVVTNNIDLFISDHLLDVRQLLSKPLQIQESVLGENHKIVLSTKDSLNFVSQSIRNKESPPPPPLPSTSNTGGSQKSSEKVEEPSLMHGMFENYLSCNIAREVEAWVDEAAKFQDSVHCG